jgi:hypothetical protein
LGTGTTYLVGYLVAIFWPGNKEYSSRIRGLTVFGVESMANATPVDRQNAVANKQ